MQYREKRKNGRSMQMKFAFKQKLFFVFFMYNDYA